MELVFNQAEKMWVAEFEASADFNLHIERSSGGNILLYQRTQGGGWDIVDDFSAVRWQGVIDYDCTALIYPKYLKIVSESRPDYAAVISSGEVAEVKSQSKEIEVTSNGTTEVTPDSGFAYLNSVKVKTNVASGGGSTPSPAPRPTYTGHADAEGLKAIGWTDEDIAYYQEHGVNWNEEDDELYKVTDADKALYGVLTADNVGDYLNQIVWLPKIDTSGVTDMSWMFYEASNMKGMPLIDTSKATNLAGCFWGCYALTCLPPIDTSNAEDINSLCIACYSLMYVPLINISKAKDISGLFGECSAINSVPLIDVSGRTFDYEYGDAIVDECYSLMNFKIKGLAEDLDLTYCLSITKESILYIINNEAATSGITITINYFRYKNLSKDVDIVAALANHPNVTLASKNHK